MSFRVIIVAPLRAFSLLVLIFSAVFLSGQESNLEIVPGDAYIELREGGDGFDLYIRAKAGLGSVLITESTADPEKMNDSFAYRSWDYNSTNGDEKRILDGRFLESQQKLYFLVDSTPELNKLLGLAFHIYIPFQLTYGYPWSREGQVEVHRGTWLNIRAFQMPYADYRGEWRDNPFVLSMKELPLSPPQEVFRVEDGLVNNVQEATNRIADIIGSTGGNIDMVLVLDTTVSMKDNIGFLQNSLVPLVRNEVEGFTGFRIGLVLYKDYKESFLTRTFPFTENLNALQDTLDHITVSGGRDLPEAVNEGQYAALTEFHWQSPERLVIQVGDAPAHEEARGAITKEMVESEAKRLGVSIYPIRLPPAGSGN